MKQIFGLLLGSGVGALLGFYARIYGFDAARMVGLMTPTLAAVLLAGGLGAVVGMMVSNSYGGGVGTDNTTGMRVVVGGVGGAASGAMYGAALATFGGALLMIVAGLVLDEARSSIFLGALGGFVIGSMAGAVFGVVIGGVVGSVVGMFIGSIGVKLAAPRKADLVIEPEPANLEGTRRSQMRPAPLGLASLLAPTTKPGDLEATIRARVGGTGKPKGKK